MAWAQEIIDFVMKMKPWTTVNEYESGLYFWSGRVLTWHLRDKKLEWVLQSRKDAGFGKRISLDEVLQQEKDMAEQYKKTKKLPAEKIAEGWHIGYLSGLNFWRGVKIQHPERSTKNLPYGIFLHLPPILDVSRVETVPTMEVVKELKFISGLLKYDPKDRLLIDDTGYTLLFANAGYTVDNTGAVQEMRKKLLEDALKMYDTHAVPFSLSGIVRYKIEDGYKAYTKVTDYERSYQSQILLTLSDLIRKTTVNDWLKPEKVEDIRKDFRKQLNDGDPRKDWGIYTIEFGFTEISTKNLQRHSQELYVPDEGLKLRIDAPTH